MTEQLFRRFYREREEIISEVKEVNAGLSKLAEISKSSPLSVIEDAKKLGQKDLTLRKLWEEHMVAYRAAIKKAGAELYLLSK